MIIVTMFWGLSYTFMVMGLETLEAYNVVALRCGIAFVIAGLIFYKKMIKVNGKTIKEYSTWHNMLEKCENDEYIICKEWLLYENF